MADHVSPGVYAKITDLSTYVQTVPGTIGMIAALSTKGEDNVLKLLSSRADLISEFGEPNITDFGKDYGQGMYCAYNFLGDSGALQFMRVTHPTSTFANMRIDADRGAADASATIQISYVTDANTISDLKTGLEQVGDIYPICILRPIGRGEYYNSISVRFVAQSNPLREGVYIMDIYEKQSDETLAIVESFEVSFDPNALATDGSSLWIGNNQNKGLAVFAFNDYELKINESYPSVRS